LAAAFEYQDDPLQLVLSSAFTKLRLVTRVRWRLEDPTPADRERIHADLAVVDSLLASVADRTAVAARLASISGDLGDTLRYELSMLPDDRWRADLQEIVHDLRDDIGVGSARVLQDIDRLRTRVFVRDGARVRVVGSHANTQAAVDALAALLHKLPGRAPAGDTYIRPFPSVQARLEQRYGPMPSPVHVGFVRPGAKSGVYVMSAAGPSFKKPSRDATLDLLAAGIFTGSGPHAFYTKTSAAGLSYSNGIVSRPAAGRLRYYAERCPDLVEAMRFVGNIATVHPLDDPFLVDYSLADAFADFRGGNDFYSRGAAIAADLADGITPDRIRRFKRLLLATARERDVLSQVRERVPDVVGRVVVGFGRPVKDSPGAAAFVIAPEELLAKYEAFLRESNECERLIRLFPRDFWLLLSPASSPREQSIRSKGLRDRR